MLHCIVTVKLHRSYRFRPGDRVMLLRDDNQIHGFAARAGMAFTIRRAAPVKFFGDPAWEVEQGFFLWDKDLKLIER